MTWHTGCSSQMHANWHRSWCPHNQVQLFERLPNLSMLLLADCHTMATAPGICRAGPPSGRQCNGAQHDIRWPDGHSGPAAAAPEPHLERWQAQREPAIDSHPIRPCEPQCTDSCPHITAGHAALVSGITGLNPLSVQDLLAHATAGASGPATVQQQQHQSPAAAAPQQAAVRRRLAARQRPAAARAALAARRSSRQSTSASYQPQNSVAQQQQQQQRQRRWRHQEHAGLPAATARNMQRRLSQRDHHMRFSHGAALEAAQHSLVGERSIAIPGSNNDMTTSGATGGAVEDFAEDLTGLGEDSATAHSVNGGGQGVDAAIEGAAVHGAADTEAVQLDTQLQAAEQQSLGGGIHEGVHAAQRRSTGSQQHVSMVHSSNPGSSGGPIRTANAGVNGKRPGILLLGDSIDRDTLIDVRWPSSRCFDSG
jgi:hypothetical protein